MFVKGSQNDQIYKALSARFGEWIPAPELALGTGYPRPVWKLTSRISDIRKAVQPDNYDVQNKTIEVDKVKHSFYRLVAIVEPDREAV